MGLPRYPHHLCDVPCPLPRRTGRRLSTPSTVRAAFPDPGGSASATALSRPAQASLALWPTASLGRPRRPLSRGFDPASVPATPLVSFRSYRLLSGWNPPPQVIRALVAHQDARGPNEHEKTRHWSCSPAAALALVNETGGERLVARWYEGLPSARGRSSHCCGGARTGVGPGSLEHP